MIADFFFFTLENLKGEWVVKDTYSVIMVIVTEVMAL